VDAAASSDAEGTLASYAWDFGDSSTGAGVTAGHDYATAGTYTITLTVTDAGGLTASTTRTVTVTDPPVDPPVDPPADPAWDDFARTASGGWGTAPAGGAWTVTGGAAALSVDGSVGVMSLSAGALRTAVLGSVALAGADLRVSANVPQLPVGSSSYVSAIARKVGAEDYRSRIVISPAGAVQLQIQRTSTTLAAVNVAGLSVAPGETLLLRVAATGSGTSTIGAKVWKAGTTEPATWQLTATDATAALQAPGSVGVAGYLGGSVTNTPYLLRFDDLLVGAAG